MTMWCEEEHSEFSQKSKMELFCENISQTRLLTTVTENSILDIWLGSEYASGVKIFL